MRISAAAPSRRDIKLRQPFPHLARANSDDGVFAQIDMGLAAENFYCDGAFFERTHIARKRTFADVLQKLLAAFASVEYRTRQNISELTADLFW